MMFKFEKAECDKKHLDSRFTKLRSLSRNSILCQNMCSNKIRMSNYVSRQPTQFIVRLDIDDTTSVTSSVTLSPDKIESARFVDII